MQDKSIQTQRSRKAKLLGGAVIGVVLSLGAVGGSASAWNRPTSGVTSVQSSQLGDDNVSYARMSGIRW